jgi:Glutathione S-transferase, N-terminal domain
MALRPYMGGAIALQRRRALARRNASARFSSGVPSMLVLRAAAPSPFARKARIVAAALELDDRIEVSAADTGDPADSLRAQNPLGKIPALILESGEVLFDSAVIEGKWRVDHPRLVAWLDVFSVATPSFEATRFRG